MNSSPRDRLYALLPAIYRIRDAAEGDPLKALLAVMEQELDVLEQDITDLYDNWFIETCADWVVPYIGDLLDVRELYTDNPPEVSQSSQSELARLTASGRQQTYGQLEWRAYVANTLAYRRRKGTAPILEQLTRDVTGWRSRAVEFARLVSTTQNLNHIRAASTTVDLRADNALQLIGTPFEQQATYTTEVRPMRRGGRYNVAYVGLFVWRLQSYPIEQGTARLVNPFPEQPNSGRYYTFSPLGHGDVPLFNQPQTETDIVKLAAEINVPAELRRPVLGNEIQQRRYARMRGQSIEGVRYFDSDPVLQIFINGQPNPIPPEEIAIRRLSPAEREGDDLAPGNGEDNATQAAETADWLSQKELQQIFSTEPPFMVASHDPDVPFPQPVIAVDPELGRLAFLDAVVPHQVEVSYLYGFSDDLGGGPYGRDEIADTVPKQRNSADPTDQSQIRIPPLFWPVEAATATVPNPLQQALQTWNQTVALWQGLQTSLQPPTHIPLAKITIPAVQVSQIDPEQVEDERNLQRQRFRPGVVGEGLAVTVDCWADGLRVTPGLAIDHQGRRIRLTQSHSIPLNLETIDWPAYPGWKGLVALSYRAAMEGPQWQLSFVPETALEGYTKGQFIPLARLLFDPNSPHSLQAIDDSVRPRFQKGIIQGLQVKTRPGTLTSWITPGKAVDETGLVVEIDTNQALAEIFAEQGQIRHVCLIRESRRNTWQIKLLSSEELPANENDGSLIPLATLDIPSVTIHQNQIEQENIRNTFKEALGRDRGSDLIIEGLTITTIAPDQAMIAVAPGKVTIAPTPNQTATDQTAADQPPEDDLVLESTHSCKFDLSQYAGRTLLLTISVEPDQGLPVSLPAEYDEYPEAQQQDWRHFAVAPPINTDTPGVILIQDNHTYTGDLSILMPPQQKLWIAAANGSRPHIRGNLWVRGTAAEAFPDQGELYLDGLLVEGKITVLAGNLETLVLNHCTLVPQFTDRPAGEIGSLQVNSGQTPVSLPPPSDPPEETLVLISLMMSCLSWMWYLIQRDLGLAVTAPKDRPAVLMHRFYQWLQAFLASWLQLSQGDTNGDAGSILGCLDWSACALSPPVGQDNNRLTLHITRTITGSLWLAETVPNLVITDSIVDKGQLQTTEPTETSGMAIAASGTAVDINASTVLGMTYVRSLEASDSIFTEKVIALRHQIGCIRFSYVPEESQTPRRYRCQPDLAFHEELDSLPEAITTLAFVAAEETVEAAAEETVEAATEDATGLLFGGTAGDGLFRLATTGIDSENLPPFVWQSVTPNLAQSHITTIAVTNAQWDTNASEPDTPANSLWVGTSGGMVFRSDTLASFASRDAASDLADWRSLPLMTTGAAVTSICQWTRIGVGKLTYQRGDEPSPSRKITGIDTQFNQELRVGDTISVIDEDPVLSQTRIVRQIISDTEILIDQAFSQDFTSVKFQYKVILIGTAGRGIFRANEAGENPSEFNQGLPNRQVTALAANTLENSPTNSQEDLFVGTWGNGVYRWSNTHRWSSVNTDLDSLNITRLIFQPNGDLLAGTDQGVFRLTKGNDTWTKINKNSTNFYVSDLAVLRIRNNNESVSINAESEDESPELSTYLYVGTTDGKILVDHDLNSWEKILDLKGLDITALAVDPNCGALFAGTRAGDVLHYAKRGNNAQGKSWVSLNAGLPNVADKLLIMDRLQPNFTSTRYGDPGYGQLRQNCAPEIQTGAEDGSEMGAFSSLKNPQREANLRASLDEYLRFGLAAEIFYMT